MRSKPPSTTLHIAQYISNIYGLHQLLLGIEYLYNAEVRYNVYRRTNAEKPKGKKRALITSGPLASGTCFSVNTLRKCKGQVGR